MNNFDGKKFIDELVDGLFEGNNSYIDSEDMNPDGLFDLRVKQYETALSDLLYNKLLIGAFDKSTGLLSLKKLCINYAEEVAIEFQDSDSGKIMPGLGVRLNYVGYLKEDPDTSLVPMDYNEYFSPENIELITNIKQLENNSREVIMGLDFVVPSTNVDTLILTHKEEGHIIENVPINLVSSYEEGGFLYMITTLTFDCDLIKN